MYKGKYNLYSYYCINNNWKYYNSKIYSDALAELDKTVFVPRHIEDKNKFNLQNVF